MTYFRTTCLSLFVVFSFTTSALAGVTTIQALSFGTFVSKKNDAQYDITINTDTSYSFDSAGFIEITAPQKGIYDLDGLPISTAITSVTITQISALTSGAKSFQMVNFQETHPASTDASGVARIEVGGTARTSGDTTAYPDATYSGVVQIQINF